MKLICLIVFRAVRVLGLPGRESWWKDAEILMLRHQLAVARRERPRAHSRPAWPDRAWLALLAGTLPSERLTAMQLIGTPATILRWHRVIVRNRRARVSHRGGSGRPLVRRKVAACGAAAGAGERVPGLLLFGAFTLVAAPRVLHESTGREGKLDLPGALSATAGMTLLVYGLLHASSHSWSNSATLAALAVGGALLVAFVLIETLRPDAALAPARQP